MANSKRTSRTQKKAPSKNAAPEMTATPPLGLGIWSLPSAPRAVTQPNNSGVTASMASLIATGEFPKSALRYTLKNAPKAEVTPVNNSSSETYGNFPSVLSQIQGVKGVEKTFGLKGQKEVRPRNSRKPVPTEWKIRYREGTRYTWKEPPIVPVHRIPNFKSADRESMPLFMPNKKDIADYQKSFDRHFSDGMKMRDARSLQNAKMVFKSWQTSHALNKNHNLEYAPIEGLLPWEMKCALEGDWASLDHFLDGEQELVEPELLKPDPVFKQQWNLAVWVFREKQAHDEHKRKMKLVEKINEENPSYWDRYHPHGHPKWEGFPAEMGFKRKQDEKLELTDDQVHLLEDPEAGEAARILMHMAKSKETAPSLPSSLKRKRTEKAEDEAAEVDAGNLNEVASPEKTAPPSSKRKCTEKPENMTAQSTQSCQSSGEGVRRSTRVKKPKMRFGSLTLTPAPHRHSPIGNDSINDAPITNSEHT